MTRMLIGSGPDAWRRPATLAVVTQFAYLIYFYVPASFAHTQALFGWLPFGDWTIRGTGGALLFFTGLMAVLFCAYGLLLRDLSRRSESPRDVAVVFGAAALFSGTLMLLPSLLSKDLFDYMAHGRVMSVYGSNPFTTPASTFVEDEFSRAMGWPDSTPLYGPAWASLCALLTLIGGGGLVRTAVIFKAVFLAAHLVNGLLVMGIVRRWSRVPGGPQKPLRAAAFYLWNPLVLSQTAGDAHNDVIVLLWILLGVWLLQRGDRLMGWIGLAMSVLTKYVTAPLVLLLAVREYRSGGVRRAGLLVATCAGIALIAYGPYLSGFQATHFLRPYEHSSYQGGLMMMVEMSVVALTGEGNVPGGTVAQAMLAATLAAAIGLGLWYLRALVRSTSSLLRTVEAGTRLLLYYLLFVTALLRASYVVWIVGMAATAASVPLRRVVAIFSATVLGLELFWIHKIAIGPEPAQAWARFAASAVAVGVPIFYLLLHIRRRRPVAAGEGGEG